MDDIGLEGEDRQYQKWPWLQLALVGRMAMVAIGGDG